MFNEEHMGLERCIDCRKEIQVGEKTVLIFEDRFGKNWVHAGECFVNYSKSLTDPKEVERGEIIGVCDFCTKPVRQKDKFDILRIESGIVARDSFFTTIPQNDAISFMHAECIDKMLPYGSQ